MTDRRRTLYTIGANGYFDNKKGNKSMLILIQIVQDPKVPLPPNNKRHRKDIVC